MSAYTVILTSYANEKFICYMDNDTKVKAMLDWYMNQTYDLAFLNRDGREMPVYAGSIMSFEVK